MGSAPAVAEMRVQELAAVMEAMRTFLNPAGPATSTFRFVVENNERADFNRNEPTRRDASTENKWRRQCYSVRIDYAVA